MLRYYLLVVVLCASGTAFGQLSKGEGETVMLAGKQFSCYLPKYFEVQEEPPGVIHKASGTFIIAVKVPQEKKMTLQHGGGGGLDRSFFEDPRYTILSLEKEESGQHRMAGHTETWRMRYNLQGYEFERYTTLVTHGQEQYVIIGNYSMILKDQVLEEVKKVMASFKIR